jgi:flotillin
VSLDRMLIDQLPLIVKEAANGLAGANVNVLNGADGMSEIAAGLVGQGLTILDSIKKNLATGPEAPTPASAEVVRVPDSQQDGQARG